MMIMEAVILHNVRLSFQNFALMSKRLFFQSKRYVMLHDGKSLMPFVSGEILTPKKFLGPIPHSKKRSGTYSNFPKIVWDYFHPCIQPNNINMKHNLMLKIKSAGAGQTF